MASENTSRGCVLLLPGGKPDSEQPFRSWQLANQRMVLLARGLTRRLGCGVELRPVRYRLRGWNGPRRDPVRDTGRVLDDARTRFAPSQIVLVGHSMGGRVAAHLATRNDAGGVVALAPWWPDDDGDLIPAGCRLLVVHGTGDTWTDPAASRAQVRHAAQRGVDASWIGIDGAGHYMVNQWTRWHQLTADFVASQLGAATQHGGGPPPG